MRNFEVIFLAEARDFLIEIDEKSRDKIIFNIDKSKVKSDSELFKKLKGEIWEFRTLYNKTTIGSLLFGIKKTNRRPWFWLLMELLSRQKKHLKKRLKRQRK